MEAAPKPKPKAEPKPKPEPFWGGGYPPFYPPYYPPHYGYPQMGGNGNRWWGAPPNSQQVNWNIRGGK